MASYKNLPREISFCKNYAENEAGKLVPNRFLFFKKALHLVNVDKLPKKWFLL